MNYVGGVLMLVGLLAMSVCMLGLGLALLDPFKGGMYLIVAVVVGAGGAQIVAKAEGGAR